MKSPFPGMDPYLEQFWREVHHALITYTRDQLRPLLPHELRPRIEERVLVETDEDDRHEIYPDIHVVEFPKSGSRDLPTASTGIAMADPIIVRIDRDPVSQGFIEIIDVASENRVVTVIEFISPSNKVPGEGRNLYRQKRGDAIAMGASMVEIDLTRTGDRSSIGPESLLAPSKRAHYLACITRGWKPHVAELYPLQLSESLPALRIPLRQTDPGIVMQLQQVFDQCYANGRYDIIDYRQPPKPPLDANGAAWAENWLRQKGLGV